jgi:hypothetical protein
VSERERDVANIRRCLALRLAVVFGILLPVFYRDWVTFTVAAVGITLVVVTYWRNCRRTGRERGT